jgi:hypothetical protein
MPLNRILCCSLPCLAAPLATVVVAGIPADIAKLTRHDLELTGSDVGRVGRRCSKGTSDEEGGGGSEDGGELHGEGVWQEDVCFDVALLLL